MLSKQKIGERLKALREHYNEKQTDIAELLNVQRQIVSYYETGARMPNVEDLAILAKHFKTSVDYLLGITDVKSTDTELKTVCEYTGLSETAVVKISRLKDEQEDIFEFFWGPSTKLQTSVLDNLISCPTFETLIDHIATYRSELTELMHDICVLKSQTGSEDFDMNKLPELENRFRASRCDYYDGLHSFEECIIYQTEKDYNYIQGNIDEIYEFLLTTRLPGEKAVEEDGEHN